MEKLITTAELGRQSISELFTLLASVDRSLTCTDLGTYQRRNALAARENVQLEINRRAARCIFLGP